MARCIIFFICLLLIGSCRDCERQESTVQTSKNELLLEELVWSYKINYTKVDKFEHGNFYWAELLPFESFYITLRLYKQENRTYMAVWGGPRIPAIFEDNLAFYTAQGFDTCFVFCNPDVDVSCIDELTKYNYRIIDNDYEPTYKEKYSQYLSYCWDMFEQIYVYGEDHKWHFEKAGYSIAHYRYLKE